MESQPQPPLTVINYQRSLAEYAQMFKALGDETRCKILGLLNHGELCVCDIMEVLKLPQSTASRHLAYLKNSGWILGTRRGKWMYYRVSEDLPGGSIYLNIVACIARHPDMKQEQDNLVNFLEQKSNKSCS